MINIYNNIRDENDVFIRGRTFLFISNNDVDKHGSINTPTFGLGFSPETSGNLFIVDEWLIEQIDKVKFIDGTLSVKDGEELIPPVKSEKEVKREALLRQIAELDAEEESEDTEEQTDEVFNEYDEIINDDFRQKSTE